MKKYTSLFAILSILVCSAHAAQQPITTITSGTGKTGKTLKAYNDDDITPRLADIDENFTDLYTNKEPAVHIGETAPADTTKLFLDSNEEAGVLVQKKYVTGAGWVRVGSHGVQYATSCASINGGMCVDASGKLYYHNGTAVVEAGSGGGSVSSWSDIQALLTGTGDYVKADGSRGTPSGTLPTLTEGQLVGGGNGGTPVAVDGLSFTATNMGWTSQGALETWLGWTFTGGGATYPSTGIPQSTGSAWGSSLSLDTDLSSASASDDSLASAKAIKAYVDAVAGGSSSIISTLSAVPYSDVPCTNSGYYDGYLYVCSGTGYYTQKIATAAHSNPVPVFYTLSVTDPGNNDVIYSNDSDLSAIINCGNGNTACSSSAASGSVISGISANAASGREWQSWGGDVTGSSYNDGTVTMTGNKSCSATFGVYDACSNTPFDSDTTTSTTTFSVGSSATNYRVGAVKTSTGTQDICTIDAYLQKIGALSGRTVYIERWSTNSSTGALVAKQEDITSFDANTISTTAGWVNVSFGKTVTLNQYDAIIVTMNATIDGANYIKFYYNASGAMTNYRGRSWNDSGTAASTGSGADMNIKLYAPN